MLTVLGMNAPAAVSFAQQQYHAYEIAQPAYKAAYGSWSTLVLPGQFRVNAIHASLLRTGKVLIVAGSGNDTENFKAGRFKTLLWDPVKETYKLIPTPDDMFCSGHAQLPDGNLLVAGGTLRYELLGRAVTTAGGTMQVFNEDPNKARTVPKGTVFTAPDGRRYLSDDDLVLAPAAKVRVSAPKAPGGYRTVVRHSQRAVFVIAQKPGPSEIVKARARFSVSGQRGNDANTLYGMADSINTGDQAFQGIKAAYEFDPDTEQYELVDPMQYARWYPTLAPLPDGKVLAVSGLDDTGTVLNGQNEIFDPATKSWSPGPTRYFATYPALFLTAQDKLFYSGSNAGYGNPKKGRTPGLWDPTTNSFQVVPGLARPDLTETSSSVLLPPAQSQKVMFLGGGAPGESAVSTDRTAVVDLAAAAPHYVAGPKLPGGPTRYLNSVILPNDTVLTTGGSSDYRGKRGSDILKADIYHPDSNSFTPAADPTVGRDYHSEALLLPDGRVVTLGSNPLFGNKQDVGPQFFEQRIEIYTPAYLYQRGARPSVSSGPQQLRRGQTAAFGVSSPDDIGAVRLMRPSSVTHATDVQQRSIALPFTRTADGSGLRVKVPTSSGLVPPGWYMLFAVSRAGVPSIARWVQVL
ncbi:radical copper oxidase GlxA [Streptacidiphilus rugosus]|uniref:galactose oxidase early set domain-containing protein n=1 Tax=Streptacidiphilus rugosus TaxID=405783 RepID=UPI000691F07B|nr:galactose oxidase early set domain-containing protein [Streptacidiphilus rugosus]